MKDPLLTISMRAQLEEVDWVGWKGQGRGLGPLSS